MIGYYELAKYYFEENKELIKPGMGSMKNISISNFMCTGVDETACSITGIPGFSVENIILRDIYISYDNRGDSRPVSSEVAENESEYPEYSMFGKLPAYGIYSRHVKNLSFYNVRLTYEKDEIRPALIFDDVQGLLLSDLDLMPPSGSGKLIIFKNASDIRTDRAY